MTIEEMKADLVTFQGKLDSINSQLGTLDEQKQKYLQAGFQLQGIITFLSQKIKTAAIEKEVPAPESVG